MTRKGKYIVLEGPEGVGKTTQINEIAVRMQKAGMPVRVLREPDSQSDLTARAIRQLTQNPMFPMNTRTEVLLYNAARSQSLEVIRDSTEQGVHCIVDRNYLTTLAIQYYGRGDVPNYDTINSIISFAVGDMEPDLCVVLDAPVTMLRERAKHRAGGERFDNLDEAFLERVRNGYLWEASQRGFPIVSAEDTPEVVTGRIWEHITALLKTRDSSQLAKTSQPASVKEIIAMRQPDTDLSDPSQATANHISESTGIGDVHVPETETTEPFIVKKSDGTSEPTKAGLDYLQEAVTDPEGNVYAFTDKLSPVTIAAAMARLSRRGDDMRVTILDEFAGQLGKDEKLLQRVITAYGDDSVQQLAGMHVVVENASNLLGQKDYK